MYVSCYVRRRSPKINHTTGLVRIHVWPYVYINWANICMYVILSNLSEGGREGERERGRGSDGRRQEGRDWGREREKEWGRDGVREREGGREGERASERESKRERGWWQSQLIENRPQRRETVNTSSRTRRNPHRSAGRSDSASCRGAVPVVVATVPVVVAAVLRWKLSYTVFRSSILYWLRTTKPLRMLLTHLAHSRHSTTCFTSCSITNRMLNTSTWW